MNQRKILVADDCRTIRSTVRRMLLENGWDVTLARNGREAVQIARRDIPDLIILDINMPRMDGYSACTEILNFMDLPVVFLTSNSAKHLEVMGRRFGAYLQKPVCPDRLIATVESLLRRHAVLEAC